MEVCWGKRYDDYALYVVRPEAEAHIKYLQTLQDNKFMDVIFLRSPNMFDNLPLLVNRDDQDQFKERTQHFAIKTERVFPDIQREFEMQSGKDSSEMQNRSIWEYYHTLNDIHKWLNKTAAEYSSITKLQPIGRSAENRTIYSFCIKERGENNYKVIVEAGTHGHEWISTAVAMYLIDQLLTSNFNLLVELKQMYTWYFIPVVNPDGYVYSHEHDRLWRKNRRRTQGKFVGVDLNRNFKFNFALYSVVWSVSAV
ncbi:zinc carboxypeptidase A 1-like [Pectinophora gossypiella]|uniref:zinc carboxypeptidase A 1-like n=1 Tax=Pectinophora gossypiella TaxID=13191 RepID=UPI00214F4C45|nr:zinc carboxypeptidase A 1-like [Pectinophora gossypiella]